MNGKKTMNPKKLPIANWWYLREFDFLPESMRFYPHKFSKEAEEEIYSQKNWRLFRTRKEAEEASNKVRQMLGLNPYCFALFRLDKENAPE